LGARLSRDPQRVARALEATKQGAEWSLLHWGGLADVVETNGVWDEAQRRLALDLLGVPHVLRNGNLVLPAEDDTAGLAELAESEMARLRERIENRLVPLDAATQMMAAAGMPYEEDKLTARLRKYEAAARRENAAALAELRRVREPAA